MIGPKADWGAFGVPECHTGVLIQKLGPGLRGRKEVERERE